MRARKQGFQKKRNRAEEGPSSAGSNLVIEPLEKSIYVMYMSLLLSAQTPEEQKIVIDMAATEASNLINYDDRKEEGKSSKNMTRDDRIAVNGIAWALADFCKESVCPDRDVRGYAFGTLMTKVENYCLRKQILEMVSAWGNSSYVTESTSDEVDQCFNYLFERLGKNIQKFRRSKGAFPTFCGFHITDACNKIISELHGSDKTTNNGLKHIKAAITRLEAKGGPTTEAAVIREVRAFQLKNHNVSKPMTDGEISRLYRIYKAKNSEIHLDEENVAKRDDAENDTYPIESGTGTHNSSEDLLCPEIAAERRQLSRDVLDALDSLEPMERKVFCLCTDRGFAFANGVLVDRGEIVSPGQAARILEIKERDVHIYLTRAKTKLAQFMKQRSYGGSEAVRRSIIDRELYHSIVPLDETQEDSVVENITRTIIEISDL